jgi:hypothetical protein
MKLLARIESSTEGSRELDVLILCAFPTLPFAMTPDDRWPGRVRFRHEDGSWDSRSAPTYTYMVDPALALSERVFPGRKRRLTEDADGGGWWASYRDEDDSVQCSTLALAVVAMILRARLKAEKEGKS